MSNKDFNIFCKKVEFEKNPKCDTKENGGLYEIISLYEYIKKNKYENFNIKTVDDTKYLLLYRFDSENTYGKNILTYFYDYKTTIKKYMKNEISLNYVEIPGAVTKYIEQWGHRPGIGINVSYFINEFYTREYLEEPYTLSEFWIPIKIKGKATNISVCVITEECIWTQISCDQKNIMKYDLIAHTDNKYEEFNITDLGRKKVKKIVQYLEKDENTLKIKLYQGDSLLDLKIETKVFENKNYNLKGGSKNYYEKYLKYKTKYLDLCCKKNY